MGRELRCCREAWGSLDVNTAGLLCVVTGNEWIFSLAIAVDIEPKMFNDVAEHENTTK